MQTILTATTFAVLRGSPAIRDKELFELKEGAALVAALVGSARSPAADERCRAC
jgi:hypothetical protein